MEYAARPVEVPVLFQGFLQRVFGWMVAGLAVTGAVAGLIGANDSLLTDIAQSPEIVLGVIVAQLALVMAISFAINRISAGLALVLFFLYAALVGVTFAFIFELYTAQSIFAGVIIFAGLTAYDMQKLRKYAEGGEGREAGEKAAVLGALALYLDFINLFLFLLRIFGARR